MVYRLKNGIETKSQYDHHALKGLSKYKIIPDISKPRHEGHTVRSSELQKMFDLPAQF